MTERPSAIAPTSSELPHVTAAEGAGVAAAFAVAAPIGAVGVGWISSMSNHVPAGILERGALLAGMIFTMDRALRLIADRSKGIPFRFVLGILSALAGCWFGFRFGSA
jgi:hypothetical protein